MPDIASSTASLRIIGDDVQPEEISNLLGCPPTRSWRKGESVSSSNSDHTYIKKRGAWLLEAKDRTPGNLDDQAADLLGQLSQDLAVWRALKSRFHVDFFCGLFMDSTSEFVALSPETSVALGQRGIEISLHIYAPTPEITENDPCPCNSGKTYENCCRPRS